MNKEKTIKHFLEEFSGTVFKKSLPMSSREKIFLLERYSKIINFLPEITINQIGLEAGLHSSIFAFSLKKIFKLNTLHALEHPTTCLLYKHTHLKKLAKNNILLKPVDLYQKKYPWENNFFDFIICSEVLEHLIPARITHMFSEFNRILKREGKLILTTPNIASLLKRINLARGKNPIEFDLTVHDNDTFGHIREFTMNEIITVLEEANFTTIHKQYYCIDTKRNIFTQIENAASKIIPSLGNDMFVIAKKTKS